MPQPQERDWTLPAETGRVVHKAFPKGNASLRMGDEVGVLYAAGDCAPLFAARGQPGRSAGWLALVTGMPFAEGLTDEQAASAGAGVDRLGL